MGRVLFGVAAILLLSGCQAQAPEPQLSNQQVSIPPELESASASYKRNRDYVSLEQIYRHLTTEMKREYVKRLLGEPDYSPGKGLNYYSSDREESPANQGAPAYMKAPVGLILDYRDAESIPTDRLQKISIGPIAE